MRLYTRSQISQEKLEYSRSLVAHKNLEQIFALALPDQEDLTSRSLQISFYLFPCFFCFKG